MYEIDKQKFGAFVAQLRKEKNYTQKQMSDTILKLLYDYNRKLERSRRSRDER